MVPSCDQRAASFLSRLCKLSVAQQTYSKTAGDLLGELRGTLRHSGTIDEEWRMRISTLASDYTLNVSCKLYCSLRLCYSCHNAIHNGRVMPSLTFGLSSEDRPGVICLGADQTSFALSTPSAFRRICGSQNRNGILQVVYLTVHTIMHEPC
jgi:hypothetical protein